MKPVFYIIVCVFISSRLYSQQQYNVTTFADRTIVEKIVDSLLNHNVKEVIALQSDSIFKLNDSCKDLDNFFTVIIWETEKKTNLIIISCDKIFEKIEINVSGLIGYKKKSLTRVRKSEQVLKFIPPITDGRAIFYYTRTNSFYFEIPSHGDPTTYVSDSTLIPYREEWYKQIYDKIHGIKIQDLPYKTYDRYSSYK
jgi:hypothetical protein